MLELNRNSIDSNAGDEVFDWCHPAASKPIGLWGLLPFLAGAAIVAGLLVWQIVVLVYQLAFEEQHGDGIRYSIVNVFVCSLFSVGLYLFHRLWTENRVLQRSVQLAEGLQEMQAAIRKANRELEHQSRTDFLTGVGNSLLMFETLEIETRRCDRYAEDLSLALIEFGGLRRLHFALGRTAVDEALRARVSLIRQGIGASDWLFRWGDGEFVVIWLNTKPDTAKLKTIRLFESLQETDKSSGLDIPVSVGMTSYAPNEGSDRLLARADLAKKDLFKGGFRFLSPSEAEAAQPDT